ncbi:MAG: ribosome maturation factor RimM [Niabella sp.]
MQKPYFSIGKFVGTHGLKGDLVLLHSLGKKTTLKGVTTLFVQEKTKAFLPWFVEQVRVKSETEVFVKLEGLDTKEAARVMLQKEVWLAEADFQKHTAKTAPIGFLGYAVHSQGNELGVIEEIIEQPHQVLCCITMQGKEVFIPLHEETLVNIDQRKKIIEVELPDGLLDIYLQ